MAAGATFLPGMTGPPLDLRPSAAAQTPLDNPFSLGVASGDPSPDGFVLWTRLAQLPLDDDGLGGMGQGVRRVEWQVAHRCPFPTRGPPAGWCRTGPEQGHSVAPRAVGPRAGPRPLLPVPPRPAPVADRPDQDGAALVLGAVRAVGGLRVVRAVGARLVHRLPPDGRGPSPTWCSTWATTSTSTTPASSRRGAGTSAVTRARRPSTLADYRRRHAQYKTDPDLQLPARDRAVGGRLRRPRADRQLGGRPARTLDRARPVRRPADGRAARPTGRTCRCAVPPTRRGRR